MPRVKRGRPNYNFYRGGGGGGGHVIGYMDTTIIW